ncbi:MAG: hypothetical protein UBAL2_80620212 [Leptospirillum rubarum]|nr:MAG: hypothetical protein UBAL2_80620212 [Leptospirillum rubarum]
MDAPLVDLTTNRTGRNPEYIRRKNGSHDRITTTRQKNESRPSCKTVASHHARTLNGLGELRSCERNSCPTRSGRYKPITGGLRASHFLEGVRMASQKSDLEMIEIDSQPATPPPRWMSLKTLMDVRVEMARVYREARSKKIPSGEASRLVFILGQIGRIIESEELSRRAELVETIMKERKAVK